MIEIENAALLVNLFGHWPDFHDAEIRMLRLDATSAGRVLLDAEIEIAEMSDEDDERRMREARMTEASAASPQPPRRRRRWRLVLGGMVVLACLAYYRGWSTEPLRLSDGREFAVLNFDRHVSLRIGPDGVRDTVRYFWVRYYANAEDIEGMLREARGLAPALFPFAEQIGFNRLQLDPSYPLFVRHFPLTVVSRSVRFERDSAGQWHESRF